MCENEIRYGNVKLLIKGIFWRLKISETQLSHLISENLIAWSRDFLFWLLWCCDRVFRIYATSFNIFFLVRVFLHLALTPREKYLPCKKNKKLLDLIHAGGFYRVLPLYYSLLFTWVGLGSSSPRVTASFHALKRMLIYSLFNFFIY